MTDILRAHVSKLTFNNGKEILIAPDDIVLFVGANNVGKSQALNDIFEKCKEHTPTVVVSEVETKKDEGSLRALLDTVARKVSDNESYYGYSIRGNHVNFFLKNGDTSFRDSYNYGNYRDLFVARLTTEERLTICSPAPNINRDQPWTNPIQYAAFDYKYSRWLSNNYCKAFDNSLIANIHHGSSIPLCVGPEIQLIETYENETERQAAYARKLETYKQVQMQGDGIKSFTGILLYLMLDYYCTYLIDEPESVLHPPQARIMGQIIGESLNNNQQAFISTHSEDILKGLLDVCEDRLKIIRISRDGDNNSFSILDNQQIKEVFRDPFLKHSNIMSGIFHKTVVLCESDSDCKFYSTIENFLKQSQGQYSETLFVHCGGKQRLAKMARALKALNVDIRIIPDMDVLNDENTIKEITKVFDIDWKIIERDYKILISNIQPSKERISRKKTELFITNLLSGSEEEFLSKNEILQIEKSIKPSSKWVEIKRNGKAAIPSGDATNAFNSIDEIFRKNHIYMVPVGELEGFVKEIGNHGPQWVNEVFEKYPDFEDEVYKSAKEFILGINL